MKRKQQESNAHSEDQSQHEQEEEVPDDDAPKKKSKRSKGPKLLSRPINLKQIIINTEATHYPVVNEVAEELGWKVMTPEDGLYWDVLWVDSNVQPQVLHRMHFFQKINHYPGIQMIARKNLLGLSLMGMRERFQNEYDFFPLTWMLPSQHQDFRRYFQSTPPVETRTYIVKPEAGCQGKGIFLAQDVKCIFLLNAEIINNSRCVVQDYLQKPFLLEGLKFDFRIYVLLAGTDPLRIYLYDEGLARLATEPYQYPNPDNLENMCMHLTNYSINKQSPNFVFNSSKNDMGIGHKRSLSFVMEELRKQGNDVVGLKEKIKDIVIKTLLTGMPVIAEQYRACKPEEYSGNMCFHILGLDIMLTDKFEPILLEVNHTPSFRTDTPLDHHIKFKLIKDTLILMNINLKTKKELLDKAKECLKERVETGKRRIFEGRQKQEEVERTQRERDEYEQANMGGYERIHPTADPVSNLKYERMLAYARKLYAEQSLSRNKNQKDQKKTKEAVVPSRQIQKPNESRPTAPHRSNNIFRNTREVEVDTSIAVIPNNQLAEIGMGVTTSLSPNRSANLTAVQTVEQRGSSLYGRDFRNLPARQSPTRPVVRGLVRKTTRKLSANSNLLANAAASIVNSQLQESIPEEPKEPNEKAGRFIQPKIFNIIDQSITPQGGFVNRVAPRLVRQAP